jgi:hypothetical protein
MRREAQEERALHAIRFQLHPEPAQRVEAENLLEGRVMTATHYLVMDMEFQCTGKSGTDTDENFDAFTDCVLEALTDLERVDPGLADPDITATIADREMTVSMRIEADTFADARRIFSANVRTALHVAGCRTAGWDVLEQQGQALPPARKLDLTGA